MRRSLLAYPPKSSDGQPIEVPQAWIDDLAGDAQRVDVLLVGFSLGSYFTRIASDCASSPSSEASTQ